MAFLDKNGLQTLTNKLVQGDAIKVASHRGHTVKNVISNIARECENVALPNTMTLENRVSEFKVGQGRDVDVSGDVEEGKVEVELKGKTWFDVVKSNTFTYNEIQTLSGKLQGFGVFTKDNYEEEGDKTYFRVCFEKIEMMEDNNVSCVISHRGGGGYSHIILNNSELKSKPFNTPITVSQVRTRNVAIEGGTCQSFFIQNFGEAPNTPFKFRCLGSVCINLTKYFGKGNEPTKEWCDANIPYFNGIQSPFEDGIIDVEVQGKNLFDGQLRTFNTNDTYIDNIGQHHNGDNNIPIKPNTSYTMTFETISGDSNIYIWNGNEKVLTIPSGKDTVSFRTPLECNSLSFYRNVADYTKDRLKYKIQLEENSKSTSYEPYYKKKISFNIGESLRSLPNGVCDEIRNNNGQWELVRRIGHTLLVGTENWINEGCQNQVNTSSFRVNTKYPNSKANGLIISDKLQSIDNGWSNDVDGIFMTSYLTIRLTKTKLSAITPEGVKAWFSNNNTNVFYELETPVVTPIEPIEFEVKPLATITINSDIAPTSNHKVILNRAGQIEQGIVQIAELKSRVDALETAYDSYLLETQHKLSLLGFEYELESEEI